MPTNESSNESSGERAQNECVTIYRPSKYQEAPPPHKQQEYLTHDRLLFEEMHMGIAVVDVAKWRLVVDGMVENPLSISLPELCALPKSSVIAFHECYGSPLRPSDRNIWRVGNVTWTGVPLKSLLKIARPLGSAQYIWSDGLDHGTFAGKKVSCYQKDLPLEKAMTEEVLVAYEMNSEQLRRERGGPVRLVVPGWFGTNSTKWLWRLSVQAQRAPGIFATYYYNRPNPQGGIQPVWEVEPNSMIIDPPPNAKVVGPRVMIRGWAWSWDGIEAVQIRQSGKSEWQRAETKPRQDFSWQAFCQIIVLPTGRSSVVARAISRSGKMQPMEKQRNCAHRIEFEVIVESEDRTHGSIPGTLLRKSCDHGIENPK
ncbi:uncharacterized protein N7446_005635 [Penicillium canescens]|uniref:Oxidoreductase molybdopterin-binding domain-containing protein n=1 Tax=Penicillium canescens TaxID=5083 RepID=A0AAD6IJ25_PENCN|nr:uncharacterized protein N7446_005635 [Penicillium canescens]KAJ6050121.1 hypothetical protein N7444_006837 [Penicillium canescens]KAJ6051004.1 hypothetical protein N7460_001538 [Penicillium canescens]KAJ6061515.1 hypothetical protein N7446_005635 [Penicillium canescens]